MATCEEQLRHKKSTTAYFIQLWNTYNIDIAQHKVKIKWHIPGIPEVQRYTGETGRQPQIKYIIANPYSKYKLFNTTYFVFL